MTPAQQATMLERLAGFTADAREYESLLAGVAALRAQPRLSQRPHFRCATCGPTGVDEDGCCRTCGADTEAVMEHQPLPAPPADISEGAWRWLDELAHASDYTGQAQQLWAGEILAALYPADVASPRQPPVLKLTAAGPWQSCPPPAKHAEAIRQAYMRGYADGSDYEDQGPDADDTFAAFLAQTPEPRTP